MKKVTSDRCNAQLAKMNIDPKSVKPPADVVGITLSNIPSFSAEAPAWVSDDA